jgi:hypothetical protein
MTVRRARVGDTEADGGPYGLEGMLMAAYLSQVVGAVAAASSAPVPRSSMQVRWVLHGDA